MDGKVQVEEIKIKEPEEAVKSKERESEIESEIERIGIKTKVPNYVLKDDFEQRLSENALWTFKKKYLLRNNDGELIETPKQAIYRIARTMAEIERLYGKTEEEVDKWTEKFYRAISNKEFSPGGRVWTNAGTRITGLFNCYVLPVHDSIEEIYEAVKNAALIQKHGGGTGYNFSEIRPRGSYVIKSKGIASGVISFIRQFDRQTEVINSGNRRGANMGILDITHPDIIDFIYAKAEKKEITNFNVSVGVTDKFMQAVENKEYYDLEWNGEKFLAENLKNCIKNIEGGLAGAEVGQKPKPPSLKIADNGKDIIDTFKNRIIGRVKEGIVQLKADVVMQTICELAWRTGDPGMIFLDEINKHNPLPKVGPIKATNPCGEQPLHPYDACNLGSINLDKFVIQRNGKAEIDEEKLREVTRVVIRFMDNVNDANKGPIPKVEETVLRHRRIGLGVMGFADMLIQLGIPYDSEEALQVAEVVMGIINDEAKQTSAELAREKGIFPAFNFSKYNTGNVKDRVRNSERTTIAPTGTISMIFDTASGIEPWFGMVYKKNVRGGESLYYVNKYLEKALKEKGIYSKELLEKIYQNRGKVTGIREIPEEIKRIFRTTFDIPAEQHIKIQAAFQRHVDNAVSKTINMPEETTIDEVAKAYMQAWKTHLKGITIYRDKSLDVQVLETGRGDKNKEKVIKNGEARERKEIIEGKTVRVKTPIGTAFVTLNYDDVGPRETFINVGKSGSDISADSQAIGRLLSLCFRYNIPLNEIIDQLKGIKSNPIITEKGWVYSLADGIAKAFEIIDAGREIGEKQTTLPIKSNGQEKELKELNTKAGVDKTKDKQKRGKLSGNMCPDCGNLLEMVEGCEVCRVCGYSRC